jgi:hypothetical protein
MPPASAHAFNITNFISVAVAPVVLISAVAILLSGYSSKYANISDRLRSLTAEYRQSDTSPARRDNLKRQIGLFRRRILAVWLTSTLLSLALLSFIGTVLSVIVAERQARIGVVGAATLIIGLVLVGSSVTVDLHEIRLARLTIAGELSDIFPEDPTAP